ncbi:uncharacterized protein LOC121409400 [Lytechinus variegatus]|uniref:uncharacterized protein LOC121409400 n=1 Tax=Lytechinus variegatus TaxID=7654 RepID=UPI001BB20DC8|nr:uncharacterized protein LOC121409400 [Lytechinus variegatus]
MFILIISILFPSAVDMATLCINSSNSEMSDAEGSIRLSLPMAAADDIEDATKLFSRPVCSFTLTSQSPFDRLILVLPNVTDSPDTTCAERSNHDRVELRLLNGPITNEVHPSEPYWNLCTSATTSPSSLSSSSANWTNQTVLTEESLSFQRIFVTSGSSVDVFLDFSAAIDSIMGYSMDELDGRDSISIFYKSFSSNAQLEDDLCIQCISNDSWASEAEICSDIYLNCSYPILSPSNETGDQKVTINCIPPEKKPRSELFSIMMAGAIVLTIIFVSFHCSPGSSAPSRRPAAMDIMLRDDISRRGGGGLGGGRGPFGNTSYKVQAPTVGKGPVSHV